MFIHVSSDPEYFNITNGSLLPKDAAKQITDAEKATTEIALDRLKADREALK